MPHPSTLILIAVATLALGAATLTPEPPAAAPAGAASVQEDPTAGSTYVGADSCKKCHFKQHKTWKAMKHASAWDVLKEEHRDPAQLDDDGRACISCHVTGWGEQDRGGFVDATTSEHLLGVGCESCHGPGSAHVELGQAMLKEKRKEFAAGESSRIVLTTTNCSTCHNPHKSHAEYAKGG